jgi:Cft2 family RNA processing exonuclease
MRFLNLTRGNEIGANSYYLEHQGSGVVLDAGMHPKLDGHAALPALDALHRLPVQAVFVSHAHHDHTGSLPLLMDRFPDTPVFVSEGTYFLADALLHNSVNVMKKQRVEAGITDYPLYTHRDIARHVQRWQACRLETDWSPRGYPMAGHGNEPVTFRFHHAGHILGSVAVRLNLHRRTVLYTGDINLTPQTLMTPADLPDGSPDVLVIETTRGAQPGGTPRETVEHQFLAALQEVFDRGGAVLIPIFAMGKTQEILALLHQAMRRGEIPDHPLHIGGLGKSFSQIYDQLAHALPRRMPHLSLFEDIHPQILDWKTIERFKPKASHIYLLPSGMMTANTTSNRLARHFLSREEHAVFFVGYTDPDSPAGKLRATPPGASVLIDRQAGEQRVRCPVRHFDFTSHAQREDLLTLILRLQPRHCLLVHGDEPALHWFRGQLAAQAPRIQVHIPAPGAWLDLD